MPTNTKPYILRLPHRPGAADRALIEVMTTIAEATGISLVVRFAHESGNTMTMHDGQLRALLGR